MAVFPNSDVDPDNFDDFKNGIHGLLDKNPRPDDAWGTIAAWAWGASRCMDYLVTDKDVAADKVAVVGHSRGGKQHCGQGRRILVLPWWCQMNQVAVEQLWPDVGSVKLSEE